MTIRSLLEEHAQKCPDAVALRFCEDKQWRSRTYAEFLGDVGRMASAYGEGFALRPREENAALILSNSPTWMEVYLACSGAGVAVVPIDPKLHNDEVAYILGDSGAVVVTTDAAHLDMMRAIVPGLPSVRAVVLADGEGDYAPIGSVPVRALAALRAEARDTSWYDAHVPGADDIASIIYTSGTTGKPKGAMLTHGNFTADAVGALEAFDETIGSDDEFLVVLPLFHAFSFCTNFVVPLLTGSQMAFVRSLYTIGEDVKSLRPTVVMGVPLLAEKIYDKIDAKLKASKKAQFLTKIGLRRLVFGAVKKGLGGRIRFMIVGGAPCPKHVLEGFKALGITMLEGYGLTECAPVVSIAGPKCARIGTIGAKIANIEIRLADQNEQGVGELQVRGPITMKGYWHNDAATAEAFDGDWLKTGDLASVAEDGLITIRGRKKALIVNREGKNIYPEEVENCIAVDPVVADCVVVGYTTGGIPGEKVGCVVHPNMDLLAERNGGKDVSWEEAEKIALEHVHAQCHALADYKRVRKIVVSKEPLARTSIQKVRRVAYKGTLDE
ncbi:MAG: AMP-binding protein [Kiritimatiellae bacterium]|nr:AMP-binding protein [Kiritimatiellia bacterium]